MALPTVTQLQNAEQDLQTLEAVANDLGTTTTRDGDTVKTVRQVIADAQSDLDAEISSAQAWASTTGSLIESTDYSSKEWAIGSTTPSGSAKEWAQLTGATVDGSEYSAKSYAQEDLTGAPGGSAKDWAIADEYTDVDGNGNKSARAWALEAQRLFNEFGSQYLGASSSDPVVDQNGDAPTEGDWYFNTTSNKVRVYDGSSWSDAIAGATEASNNEWTGTNSFIDTNLTIKDDADGTKAVQFQLSGITTGNTRTLSVPDASTTLVGTDTTQTLTGKTVDLTDNTLTGTLAEFNTALSDGDFASLAGTETLTNKTLDLTDNTLTGTLAEFNAALSDDDFASLTGAETLTNKTLTQPVITVQDTEFTVQDNADNTKQLTFDLSGISTGTTRQLSAPDIAGTLALTDAAQTISAAHTFSGNIVLTGSPDFSGIGNKATLRGDLELTNADILGRNFTPSYTGGSARTLRSKVEEVPSLLDFGAVGDGATDDSAAIQAAQDYVTGNGGRLYAPGDRTYLCNSQILLDGDVEIFGPRSAVFKSGNGLDAPLFINRSGSTGTETDIVLRGFSIDGNKANQTALAEGTGVKLIKVARAKLLDLYIFDTEGHSIHLSNQGATVEGQVISGCIIDNPGSSAGGTFGSCIAVTNGYGVTLEDLFLTDSAKAGLRLDGTGYQITNVRAIRNGNGGLVPVSGAFSNSVINGGWFEDNGPNADNDGIRLVAADNITLNGVICTGNDGAGLMILNGCTNISVNGGVYKNNGQNADAIIATTGRDGITIKDSGTANTNITINGAHVYDDQGTPTQDYGITIQNNADQITVSTSDFGANKTGRLSITAAGDNIVIGADNRGLSYKAQSATAASATGTTASVVLFNKVIAANEINRNQGFRFIAGGTITGTAGTKLFRVRFGGQTHDFDASASGDAGDWMVDVEVWLPTISTQRVIGRALIANSFSSALYAPDNVSFTSSRTLEFLGKLSNSADDITMDWYALRPLV